MAIAARIDARRYRLPWYVIVFGDLDPRSRRSFAASGALGLALLGAIALAPALPERAVPELEAMPERFAKLILEKPAPPAPKAPVTAQTPPEFAEAPPKVAQPEPEPRPRPRREAPARPQRRVESQPQLAPDQGEAGREQAQAATAAIAQSAATLDKTLAEISAALPAAEAPSRPAARGRRGRLRRGASRGELARVDGGVSAAAPAAAGPVVLAAGLSVDLGEAGGSLLATGGAGGEGRSAELRSNASLLAVMQRYAPGIRYCYDSALKRRPELAGKLVLRLTVAASGAVRDVAVAEDALGDPATLDCVLAQVAAWRFEAIAAGEVSFRAPLVFTAND